MAEKEFDYSVADSQGTSIKPIDTADFDIAEYQDYESQLLEQNRKFWLAESGIAIYRRFRVPEVFSYGCKDMKFSLGLQLAALQESMKFKADVANFLEPWYGLGAVASCFGINYQWPDGQAPAIKKAFENVNEALDCKLVPAEQTAIGKHVLEMIEYFLDKTQGKIPMSFTDTQSSMNASSFIVDINNFFLSLFDDPEALKKLLDTMTDSLIDFTKIQADLIGDALVYPGHGFTSSRVFTGLGMSDDVMIMLSPDQYSEFCAPSMARSGEPFGGAVFHSCGNWSSKINGVKSISNLVMVDGAFSKETDPDPNPAEPFAESFSGTNVVVNARIVGDRDVVVDTVKKLYKPPMKLIVVTYCQTPEEQADVYEKIHAIA